MRQNILDWNCFLELFQAVRDLDLNTPKSDGFVVLEKLRRAPHLAEVPIAIITSSQAMSDKRRVSLIGRTRYIEKPSQLAEFLTTVGQAVKDLLHLND